MTWFYLIVSFALVFYLVELWLSYVKESDALLRDLDAQSRSIKEHQDGILSIQQATAQAKLQVESYIARKGQLAADLHETRQTLKEMERRQEKRRLRQQRLQEAQ